MAATGNLTLLNTTVSGGLLDISVQPFGNGQGGGIFNRGILTLVDSTVSGNSAFVRGGGIDNAGSLTLTSSTVLGNSAGSFGGGISNVGTLTLDSGTVSGNTAGYFGSGISNFGTLTLESGTVSGNTATAGYGSSISNSGGTLTVTNSTISGNTGGGISNDNRTIDGTLVDGTLSLTNSTVSGNTGGTRGGGIENSGILTVTNSTVSGNTTSDSGGGIRNGGTVSLTNSTVEANSAQSRGGGIYNFPGYDYAGIRDSNALTLTNSTVSGNTGGTSGGGVSNGDLLTVSNSTVSGNTASDRGGGVDNAGTATLTNSTVSSNTATERAGGMENSGTVTFTNSTVSHNASGRVAGGLFNTGTVTLVQSLLSGNTAVNGPEAYSVAGQSGGGTVIADGSNVIGHDGSPGITGFTLGASDFVPADPLAAILDPTLAYNGGATRTHALVFGSPAVDAVLGAACATGTDQRGAPRAQDGDGDTFADCDSGAVERGQVPVQVSLNSTRLACRTATCQVPVTCNLTEADCTNDVEITVRARPRRNSDGTETKAARPIRFAFGSASNIPPGGSGTVTLRLTKQGKRLVRATKKRRLKGVLGIREIAASVSNTPLTISRTNVTIRLKRRK